jgi:membrane protease YdiL (CAAX protease family)
MNNEIKSEIRLFFTLLIVLTVMTYLWMFAAAGKNPMTVAVMMWVPGISALLTVVLKKMRLAGLGWRAGKWSCWAQALLFPILVSLIAYGIAWLSGLADFYADEVVNYRWAKMLGFALPAPFLVGILAKGVFASLMALPFVLGEEIGWSGFLVPRLRGIFTVPVTSVIVGLSWSVWHFPAIIGGIYGTKAPLWIQIPGFTLVLTGASFFRTILVCRARSLWPGVILHVSHNVFLMGIFYEMTVKGRHSAWIVSESGILLGAVYLACGWLCWRIMARNSSAAAS